MAVANFLKNLLHFITNTAMKGFNIEWFFLNDFAKASPNYKHLNYDVHLLSTMKYKYFFTLHPLFISLSISLSKIIKFSNYIGKYIEKIEFKMIHSSQIHLLGLSVCLQSTLSFDVMPTDHHQQFDRQPIFI